MSAGENYLRLRSIGANQPASTGNGDRFQLTVRAELGEHRLHVPAAGVEADAEPARDGPGVETGRHQLQHFVLPDGEAATAWTDHRCGTAQETRQDVGRHSHAAAVS